MSDGCCWWTTNRLPHGSWAAVLMLHVWQTGKKGGEKTLRQATWRTTAYLHEIFPGTQNKMWSSQCELESMYNLIHCPLDLKSPSWRREMQSLHWKNQQVLLCFGNGILLAEVYLFCFLVGFWFGLFCLFFESINNFFLLYLIQTVGVILHSSL